MSGSDGDLWGLVLRIAIVAAWVAYAIHRFTSRHERKRRGPQAPPPTPTAPAPPAARPGASAPLAKPSTAMARPAPPPAPQAPRPSTAGAALDAGMFAPLEGDAAKGEARNMGALSFFRGFFSLDRRDRIPPASDPRTRIIDRVMVGKGLLTPEDLVEIHDVGEAMETARPSVETVDARVDAEMAKDDADREAVKARKKAEAKAREERRREEVARRKATDIIFLGRGVSRGLADRRADVERLERRGLPVLASPADVAKALGLAVPRLRWLAFHSEAARRTHYVRFTVPKRSGGTRTLAAPHEGLKRAQRWILANILAKVRPLEPAHGFVPGRSTRTNALPHVGKAAVVNADLKDFFPTIAFPRVRGIFEELGYSPAAATILALLSTEAPRREAVLDGQRLLVAAGPRALPQGAPTSPALSNLAARGLDARLSAIARRLGWAYTRYADDITFSAGPEKAKKTGYLLARLRHIALDEGFAVNEKKTRVQRRSRAQTVTGVVVNERPGAPRKLVRRLRAIIHRAKQEGLAKQNREGDPLYESRLRGQIAYVEMLNEKQGKALCEAYEGLARR